MSTEAKEHTEIDVRSEGNQVKVNGVACVDYEVTTGGKWVEIVPNESFHDVIPFEVRDEVVSDLECEYDQEREDVFDPDETLMVQLGTLEEVLREQLEQYFSDASEKFREFGLARDWDL